MSVSEKNRKKTIHSISPIYEKVFSPNGDGFAGFTIFFAEDGFTNHIRFFEKDNHQQITKQVENMREVLCKSCKMNPETTDYQDYKEKNL